MRNESKKLITKNTKTMYINSKTHNSIAMFYPKKPDTLAGFEPESAVSEADAMSTALARIFCLPEAGF
jgi:hypothetical protein